jgi:hypothetical protein
MTAETTELRIRIPKEDADFAKSYAETHGVSVTEIIDRYLRLLRTRQGSPSAEVERMSGLLPPEIDGRAVYRQHQMDKHGR